MDVQHFTETVTEYGTVTMAGLPPDEKIDIAVSKSGHGAGLLRQLSEEFKKTSPLARMGDEEVLTYLKQTREEVWNERYQH